ncbi:MAG: hypothetical protein JSW55_14755 [Chloroflexota bacterium]|nr:MAG: hypothetical protein JSW55_14755 [Chloroflexota bacterium]
MAPSSVTGMELSPRISHDTYSAGNFSRPSGINTRYNNFRYWLFAFTQMEENQMVEIRRIGVLSTAVMFGLLNAALGLIIGLLFACATLLSVASLAAAMEDLGIGGGGVIIGLLYAVCFPILYGAIGFVFGAVLTILYNIIAGFAGGIKMELKGPGTG